MKAAGRLVSVAKRRKPLVDIWVQLFLETLLE
jgi:hypothetical protein